MSTSETQTKPESRQPSSSVTDTESAMHALTEWEALKKLGYWQTIDTVLLALQLCILGFMGAYEFFEDPVLIEYMLAVGIMILVQGAWITVVSFRNAHFTLSMHANVNMMPQESARIAVAYLSGKMNREA